MIGGKYKTDMTQICNPKSVEGENLQESEEE